MPRLLFEKTGNAIWISHLDLMRLFQRAFRRAGLPLTHTQGFNPRPSVSIAMPLSVGIASSCELLDFELEGIEVPESEILQRLNAALIPGVRVLAVYSAGKKIRELAYLDCELSLCYDAGIPTGAPDAVRELFERESLTVDKKSKNGVTRQDIIPMIRSLSVCVPDEYHLLLSVRVCCQNPSLNPMLLVSAVHDCLPELVPDDVSCRRVEIYDQSENVFR